MNDFNIDLILEEMINKVEYSSFLLEYHQIINQESIIP
jgi:hypothetical protein